MIARHWRRIAKSERASDYVHHCARKRSSKSALPGFVNASILQRSIPAGVEFLIVTHWRSVDAIRAFAGDAIDTAVVPAQVREMLIDYDRNVQHFEVIE